MQVQEAAASVLNSTWAGSHGPDGQFLWYGSLPGANVSGETSSQASTTCTINGTCTGDPGYLAVDWIVDWVKKDFNFDVSTLTVESFAQTMKDSIVQFQSLIESNNPDLSQFKARGGKLISYHGLVSLFVHSPVLFNANPGPRLIQSFQHSAQEIILIASLPLMLMCMISIETLKHRELATVMEVRVDILPALLMP